MKKISVIVLALLLTQYVGAQKSFYSGALVFSANYGFDGNIANRHYFNQSQNAAQTLNGMAPASNVSLDAEYGLLKWLGAGLVGRFDNYFSENNQVTHTATTAGAVGLGITGNAHFLRSSNFDLLGGLDWGVSQFTYHINNGVNTRAYGNGNWSDIHATGRLYYERFGVNLSLYAPTTSYSSFQSSNYSPGEYVVNYWKSTGYGASVGLEYRLF